MSLPPASALARYRVLSPSCGLRVSPLQLGAMSLGQANASTLGSMTKELAFELLDKYYNLGGNYIDTANGYQEEESEIWIGEWLAKKGQGVRDDLVIATKFTGNYKSGKKSEHPISVNRWVVVVIQSRVMLMNDDGRAGNSYKSMAISLEASLKKLQTTYVDVLCKLSFY
jgi:aryl-alcohol dehydrogenase-like predicted oxidoreductase